MAIPLAVLIVEDSESDAQLIVRLLKKADYEINFEQVETAAQMRAALEKQVWDVVISDYSLPQFSGKAALILLQEMGLDIPFIVVSGTIGEETAVDMMKAGAHDYLMKGNLARLAPAVKRELAQAEVRRERKRAEEAVKLSNRRFRALIENSADAITLLDANGIAIYDSPAAPGMLGYGPDELIGQNVFTLMHPDDLPKIQDLFQNLLKTPGARANSTFRLRHKNGTWLWIEAVATNLLAEPSVKAIAVNYRDISERKRAEEALRESEERYRTLIEQASDGIFLADNEGRYIEVNSAGCRLLGYTREEILQKTIRDLTVVALAQPLRLDEIRQGKTILSEREMIRKDGTLVSVEISAKQFPNGKLQGIARDITERKQVAEALTASESELRALFASMHDVVLVIDRDGVYRKIGPTKPINMYKPPEEILGKSLAEVFPEEQAQFFLNTLRQVLATEQTTQIEYQLTFDGQTPWFEASISPMTADSTLWVARDITERKKAEERIRQQLERLTALRLIDQAITASFEMHIALNILLQQVTAQLQVAAAAVLLHNPHMHTLEFTAGHGFRGRGATKLSLRLGEDHAGKAALERHLISIPDLTKTEQPLSKAHLTADEGFIAYYAVPLIAKGQVKGVLEIFNRARLNPDKDWLDFLQTLASQAAIAIDNAELFNSLHRSNTELMRAYDATIEGWSRALDLRDKETEGHTQRVTEMTLRLAQTMGQKNEELIHIRRGALLHDMGKLGIPDHILLKPDKLSDDEWVIMKKHPQYAYDMLSPVDYLRRALDIPYCHHEKWDGTGYPRRLKGEQIPLAARIFAVVDVWDALRSDRPYRAGWSAEKVHDYIRQQNGAHFDPQVVEVFLKLGA